MANLWKNSLVAISDYPDIANYEWNIDIIVHWLHEQFPEGIENISLDDILEETTDDEYGSERGRK